MHHSVDGRVAAQVAKCFPWVKNWDPRFEWVIITFTVKSVDLWGMHHFWITQISKTFKNYQQLIRGFIYSVVQDFFHPLWCTQVLQTMAENGVAPHLN